MKRTISLVARITLGVGIVAFLISRTDLSQLEFRPDARMLFSAGGAVASLAVAMLLSAIRWRLVLGPQAPSVLTLWRIYLIGWFFSLFLPTSVGGDAVRAVALGRSSSGTGGAFSSIVLERLLGVAALGFYLLLGCALAPAVFTGAISGASVTVTPGQFVALLAVGGLALWGMVVIARRIPRLNALLSDGVRLWTEFRRSPARIGFALLVSGLLQALYIATWYVLAWGLRLELPLLTFLVFVPLVSLAAMLPITLSGLGVREGVWAVLLAPFGVSMGEAVVFGLSYHACSLLLGGFGGLLFGVSGIRVSSQPATDLVSDADVSPAPVATLSRA